MSYERKIGFIHHYVSSQRRVSLCSDPFEVLQHKKHLPQVCPEFSVWRRQLCLLEREGLRKDSRRCWKLLYWSGRQEREDRCPAVPPDLWVSPPVCSSSWCHPTIENLIIKYIGFCRHWPVSSQESGRASLCWRSCCWWSPPASSCRACPPRSPTARWIWPR